MTPPELERIELQTEQRAGVTHYVTGQHHAWREADDRDTAILLYIDTMGWAVIVACECERGTPHCLGMWVPVWIVARTSANGVGQAGHAPPDGFELSPAMVDALDHAEVVE